MNNTRKILEDIIEKLRTLAESFGDLKTCANCGRPAFSRGFCGTHYGQWRRDYCKEKGVKKLRDLSKNPRQPDVRQKSLFNEAEYDETIERFF